MEREEEEEGLRAEQLFLRNSATSFSLYSYTFDDLYVFPLTTITSSTVTLSTKITKELSLFLPIVSSPMDTVTEHTVLTVDTYSS